MNRERALEIVRKARLAEADQTELQMLDRAIARNWVERGEAYEAALSALMDFVETLFTTIHQLAKEKDLVTCGVTIIRAAHGMAKEEHLVNTPGTIEAAEGKE